MPAVKSDAFVLKFKADSLLTVSRERFDKITERLGLNQTNTIHLALSRLYEDLRKGRLANAGDLNVGYYPPDDGYPDAKKLAKAQAQVFAENPGLAKVKFTKRALDL
jgi:hypothetical protein